jgi:DNA (cytosine-5)-methyltransferase 1
MIEINQLDLFSGIGGFHLGFHNAGYKINSYFSEVDKYAIQVYQNNFKDAKYVGSVTDVQGGDLPRIDLITFGSPCQDFSLAGKRKGMGGDRSSLITHAIRLIDECRPRLFIWENVKGTFSSNNGEDFWAIIQAFTNLGGYRLEWQLLNTKWFLPQNRERIYLVGYLADGSGRQVFPISEVAESFVESGRGNRFIDVYNKTYRDECPTLTDPKHSSIRLQSKDKIRKLTPIECERLQGFPDNWTKSGTQGEISDSQRYKMCGNAVTSNVVYAIAERCKFIFNG